jgi:hypothetical protein
MARLFTTESASVSKLPKEVEIDLRDDPASNENSENSSFNNIQNNSMTTTACKIKRRKPSLNGNAMNLRNLPLQELISELKVRIRMIYCVLIIMLVACCLFLCESILSLLYPPFSHYLSLSLTHTHSLSHSHTHSHIIECP